MPRYYFDRSPTYRDEEGQLASGPEEARNRATEMVGDCMQGKGRLVEDGDAIAIDVRDGDGNHIATARLALSVASR